MDGATTLLSTSSHFPVASKDFLPQVYHTPHATPAPTSTRKRKPVVTYQSPGSGIVDVGLLVRNTALEIEAAAAVAARVVSSQAPAQTALTASGSVALASGSSSASTMEHAVSDNGPTSPKIEPLLQPTRGAGMHRPLTIPRPPRPLYHPLSRPSTSKPTVKTSTTTSSSSTLQLVPPPGEAGRRSSSRTRRPAAKVRDTESMASVAKVPPEKPSPAKRRRGPGGGKRKRGVAQVDVDGDGAYTSTKRTRKARERVEVEAESETMPPPTTSGTSPPPGYLTRAKRPRKVTHTRAGSSTPDGTGTGTRTTPVNGPVEEFWVPTKSST